MNAMTVARAPQTNPATNPIGITASHCSVLLHVTAPAYDPVMECDHEHDHPCDDGCYCPCTDDTVGEWQPGECDHCWGIVILDAPMSPVCACATGQGAPLHECVCGPPTDPDEYADYLTMTAQAAS